jgi:hypothetical protein
VLIAVASAGALLIGLSAVGPAPSAQAAYRPASPTPGSHSAYLAEVKADASEIASHIGHSLSLPLSVVVNTTQKYGTSPAYTFVYDGGGGMTGPPARCTAYINPNFTKEDAEYQKLALVHEVFHCFEALDYPTLSAYYAAPAWLIEGEAEWVGATLAPTSLPVWDDYLTDPDTSLFDRSYDAIGFYAHMTNSGEDTWHLLDAMLKAGGSAAAYSVAADKEVRLTWASSLARQSGFGKGWQTTGPGITSATYHPTLETVGVGTKISDTVGAYTNALVEFKTQPGTDIVDIAVSTPYSRLHTANGTEYDDVTKVPAFCLQDCDKCPQVQALPRMTAGTNWLAVTGDATGATYTVAGAMATCAACLVGNWTVTNLSLITNPGGTHSGGAGTEVDIAPDGDATGNFTPGAPLVGGGGSVKFSGTIVDHYGFPPDTTARSGSFTSTPVLDQGTISLDGSPPRAITPETESGSYSCVGTGLTLTFTGGGSGELVYTLVPAS